MIEMRFNAVDNAVCLICEEDLSLEDIVQSIRQWIQHDQYAAEIDIFCDVRQAQWLQAVTEFLQVSDAVVERINQNWQGRKVAIVTNSHTEIALIESHLDAMGWHAQWRGFISTEAARQWLGEHSPQTANAN